MLLRPVLALLFVPLLAGRPSRAEGASLEDDLGRNEVRVRSAAAAIPLGRTVEDCGLVPRLERLGYTRVKGRPAAPGEYFWGTETFWVFRRATRHDGREVPAELFGLRLAPGTLIITLVVDAEGQPQRERRNPAFLEPEVLAESLTGDRAAREAAPLSALPPHVWQAVLAIEDHRFFEHSGLDARSIARAALANLKVGGVAQGGSTLTQQLVKNRDLTPRRTLGRKVSEAVRALALEADHDKEEILGAYLDHVYLGHVDGLAVHGIGTAARVYFSKDASRLTLAEAATLAGVIESPNRLSPLRHATESRARRDVVLARLAELGWIEEPLAARAARQPLEVRSSPPRPETAPHFVAWAAEVAGEEAPRRVEAGRGVVIETTLDPWVQVLAERAVVGALGEARKRLPRSERPGLQAGLVALDALTGDVLAHVGGDPRRTDDHFDRVRKALRQPGSTVKPLVLLEAFGDCGGRGALFASTRVLDAPVTVELPDGTWAPSSPSGRHAGVVDVRTALRDSLNTPFVRLARHCGFESVAATVRRAGLDLPAPAPPAFVLGAVETSPLALARAFTILATPGDRLEPRPVSRVERPGGRGLGEPPSERVAVTDPATAWIVRDLLREAAAEGTGQAASFAGEDIAGKTGTSSGERDAWFAGHAGSIVAVAWMGRDDGRPADVSGPRDAAALWRAFMEPAVRARPVHVVDPPESVVVRRVDPATGLLLRSASPRGRDEVFRRSDVPRRDRFLWHDEPEPVIR